MEQAENTNKDFQEVQKIIENGPQGPLTQSDIHAMVANFKGRTIVLEADEILGAITQFGGEMSYREGSRMEGTYYNFKFRGSMFTSTPQFQKDLAEKKVIQMTLTETMYIATRPDPSRAGGTIQVPQKSWSLDGWLTTESSQQILNARKAKISGEFALKVHERKMSQALQKLEETEVNLSESEFEELMKGV